MNRPPDYRLTNDKSAIVTRSVKWLPVDEYTPVGIKMLLINRAQGVATVSIRRHQDGWTHWYPLPTFSKLATVVETVTD